MSQTIETGNNKKSNPERKRILFKKFSKWYKTQHEKAEFDEPIAIFMRRGRKTEFFENVKAGEWTLEHSDGTERTYIVDPSYIRIFEYGDTKFSGYIFHEDFPLPLPEDPTITAELMGIALEKTLNDIKKWKTEEIKAKGDFYWKIAMGIVAIIGMYILFRLLFPQAPEPVPTQTVAETAKTVVENSTVLIQQPQVVG